MAQSRKRGRTDGNHTEIINALRKIGCYVIITAAIPNTFDLLVAYRGNTFIIEVKDGAKPPSKTKLTKGENKCKEGFERVGVEYHVVYSVGQAINLVTKI